MRTYKFVLKKKPDLIVGFGEFYIAQISKLLGIQSIILTDTDNAVYDKILTFPFAADVLIPNCYQNTIKKSIRFDSYKELAYLSNRYFTPDPYFRDVFNLKPNEKIILFRFSSQSAVHDFGKKTFTFEIVHEIVKLFLKFAKVYISSEEKLPNGLEKFSVPVAKENIHQLVYHAGLVYGNSATMAAESACLGTPSIFLDYFGRGYTDEIEKKYGLIFNYKQTPDGLRKSIKKAIEIIESKKSPNYWNIKRRKLLSEKIDVTSFLTWFIDQYPDSSVIMRRNPDYQYRFRIGNG